MDEEAAKRVAAWLRKELATLRADVLHAFEKAIRPLRADIDDLRLNQQAHQLLLNKLADEEQVQKAYTNQIKKSQQLWAWRLAGMIDELFDDGEVRQIAYGLGVDIDNVLVGQTKKGRVINLCEYFRKRARLLDLATHCQALRPMVSWPLLATEADITSD